MSDTILALWTRIQNLHIEADERGATAVEYGMMVALIAAVIAVTVGFVGTVATLGGKVNNAFTAINGVLK